MPAFCPRFFKAYKCTLHNSKYFYKADCVNKSSVGHTNRWMSKPHPKNMSQNYEIEHARINYAQNHAPKLSVQTGLGVGTSEFIKFK